ncbi:hypothetical protein [Pedobacter cryoconitis]|uniref:YD repeat-containing protein n=1 Tax=Pedobacter cryoconitis TaxID=188932 RepID=A0A7X0MGJ3_9SPHI|nr:hypothetical protein [Pedobacter cryoconitis]MBB6498154.1 hypothetical protein [Pedobacter cryoconitis]
MKKNLLLLLLFYSISFKLFAQVLPQTPNAAELGRYGQVPTDLFNGLPQISVPIHTVKIKDIEVPIQLSYYASGIKVEQHPTWVGLGWNLSAGGSITRIVNGAPDETTRDDIARDNGTTFSTYGFGYFYKSKDLDIADWAGAGGFNTLQMGINGEGQPDEFMINAPGINASFYLYRDALDSVRVKVKSKDGRRIRVKVDLEKDLALNFYNGNSFLAETLFAPFYRFTVKTEDGKTYVFGGDVAATEYSSSPAKYFKALPTTWYLTSITGISGGKVNFTYQRDGNPIVVSNVISKTIRYIKDDPNSGRECQQGCVANSQFSYGFQHPIYLSGISGSDGTQIGFIDSRSTELPYEYNETFLKQRLTSEGVDYHAHQTLIQSNYWMKLDEIVINGKKRVKFNYTADLKARLKLNNIAFNDADKNQAGTYTFAYNPMSLPGYNSKMSDNWGYYNGKMFEGTSFDQLYQYRSADPEKMKAEILTSITYPTGGATSFYYEAHDYSKIASQLPDFKLNPVSGTAGGLRVSKIVSKPDPNSSEGALTKEYSYVNADNSSSGILSGIPLYHSIGRMHVEYDYSGWSGLVYFRTKTNYDQTFDMFSENYVNMLGNTNGNHVTYSRIVEKTSGNGKVVYKYTNHDTFPDLPPLAMATNFDDRTFMDKFISRELERGLLISQETYNELGMPVETVTNEYNSSPERYNDLVKSISLAGVDGLLNQPFVRLVTTGIYTFYPYLQKKTVTSYFPSAVSKTTQYSYDADDKTLSSVVSTDSKGDISTATYTYPGNLKETSPVYKTMYNDLHMISPVIEERQALTKSGQSTSIPLSLRRTNYSEVGPGVFMPGSVEQSIGNYATETLVNYTYDNNGNISTKFAQKGPSTSYIWGYKDQYPIAIIENANNGSSVSSVGPRYLGMVIPNNSSSNTTAFTTGAAADISLQINGDPGFTYTLQYTLTSGTSIYKQGSLCANRTSSGSCNYPSVVVFPNLPAGNYIMDISGSSAPPAGLYRSATITYQEKKIVTKGAKEFFYEGFEENTNGNVITGNDAQPAYTGNKFWNGNYQPVFDAPSGRSYIIQWWSYTNSKWSFNQKAYSANLTLTGPVDDVRIFPVDAKMRTYTYSPQVGMTSQTDEKGQTFYYLYDGFQRLITVKDQNGNIIKSYSYNIKS